MVDKAIKVMREVVEPHRYGDICGEEIRIGLACSTARCTYCGKDLCENHIGYEEETPGDYRVVYCENCWNLGEQIRPIIEELQSNVGNLYKEWQDKCKE